MRSYLDTIRKPVNLPLLEGEEVIKYYTASYDIGSSLASSWRLGNLYLTNKRLLFVQVRKILFEVLLSQIKSINIVKRGWILGKKVKQLNIVCEGRRVPYIAIKDPENWKWAIEERTQESQSTPSDPQPTAHNSQPDEVILKGKGSYLSPGQSRWRLGTLLLTHNKLTFFTYKSGFVWETPLSSIKDLRIEKRVYGVSQSDTICVVYESFGELSKAWIISLNLKTWRKELYERALLKVDRETLDKIVTKLDADSKGILWFLYENRHARIDTLAKLIEAPIHMDVLLKIREIINPTAEKIIGYPILSFESSKVDWETGEKVTFSWWILGQKEKKEEEEILLDIFDEEEYLNIIMELPGVRKIEDILFKLELEKMTISTSSMTRKYCKEIDLPVEVNTKDFSKSFNNNVLEVKLKKAKVGIAKDT